jgi:hypothetical protein
MRARGQSNRVGNTVLRLSRLGDIMEPGASQRAVFIDHGFGGTCFRVAYYEPRWIWDAPPIHHAEGATLSMADAHAEYWKWKARETIDHVGAPQTEQGLYDLQRVQKATWGRLGYSFDERP